MDFQKALEFFGKVNKEELKPIVGVTTATVVALYTLYSLTKGSSVPAGLSLPPTVKEGNYPYVGHLFSFGKDHTNTIENWHKKYGPIMTVKFGVVPYVIIGDPYLAQEIFTANGAVTSDRPRQIFTHEIYSINERGLAFTGASKRWNQARAKVLDILTPKNVQKFAPVIYKELEDIIDYLIDETSAKGSVKVLRPLQYATTNVMFQTTLAKRSESLEDPLFTETMAIIDTALEMAGASSAMSTFLPVLKFLDVIFRKERKMRDFVENKRNPHYRKIINECLESGKDCFLKSLAQHQKDTNTVDADMLLVTVTDIVTGGGDTSAVTLSWFLAIICHHPDLQQRLRDEVDAFLKEHRRYPDFADRDHFPLLSSVQKECLRYRPITPFGALHMTTEDLNVRGYFIPKGTTLAASMHALNHNEKFFENPDEFIPERFMNEPRTMSTAANGPIEKRDHFNFGWGRRICPGIHLAEVEMFKFTTSFFAKAIVLPKLNAAGEPEFPDIDNFHDGGLVLHPIGDGEVRLVARTDIVKF